MSFARLALAGGLLAACAGTAEASCVTTAVCTESTPVVTCVGNVCTAPVYLPLCVHGQVGTATYQTFTCH